MRPYLLPGLALLLLLAGCDAGTSPTPTPPAPTATPTPGAGAAIITFDVSGGIAGIHDVLTIDKLGAARLTNRTGQTVATLTVPPAQLQRLIDQFHAADFFHLQDRYDNGGAADDIYSAVTYVEGGQSKTVTVATAGGQGITPQALLDLINLLQGIRAAAQGTPVAAPPAPAASPTPGSATPVVTGTPVPGSGAGTGNALITYRVTGGIAGLNTAMYIGPQGGVRFTNRDAPAGQARLTPAQLQELKDLFTQSDFLRLDRIYAPPIGGVVADGITVVITYDDGNSTNTVQVETGGNPPAALGTIMARLAELEATLQPQP